MIQRLAAVVAVVASLGYLVLALRLPAGTRAQPGPGFYPVLVGVILAVAASGYAVRTGRASGVRPDSLSRAGRRRVLAVLGAFAGFCLLLPRAGYGASALLFVAVALRQLGASWPAAALVAVAAAGLSYAVFVGLLDVPLPRGSWLD